MEVFFLSILSNRLVVGTYIIRTAHQIGSNRKCLLPRLNSVYYFIVLTPQPAWKGPVGPVLKEEAGKGQKRYATGSSIVYISLTPSPSITLGQTTALCM
jgi:hypothetical protein